MSWSRESGWCGGNRAQRPVSACSPWVPCTRRARHPPMPAAPAADESNFEMVRPAGFEPATSASAGQRSIHLSYGRDKREYERPAPRWKRLAPCETAAGTGPGSNGGERGIRTPGTFYRTHDFQSCTFSLSVISPRNRSVAGKEWRRERDSNPRGFRLTVFKTAAFDRSAISPLGGPGGLARRRGREPRPARWAPPRSRRTVFFSILAILGQAAGMGKGRISRDRAGSPRCPWPQRAVSARARSRRPVGSSPE